MFDLFTKMPHPDVSAAREAAGDLWRVWRGWRGALVVGVAVCEAPRLKSTQRPVGHCVGRSLATKWRQKRPTEVPVVAAVDMPA